MPFKGYTHIKDRWNGREGFPDGSYGKESTCNVDCRPEFNPWVGKIPWRRVWQPTSVFLPGESPWTEDLASCSP